MKEIIIEEVPVSNCCGTVMYGGFLDVLICPSCREYCEVEIVEEEISNMKMKSEAWDGFGDGEI